MNDVLATALDVITCAFASDTIRRVEAMRDELMTFLLKQQQPEQENLPIQLDCKQLPPFLIALGGVAGSGKTTLAKSIGTELRRGRATILPLGQQQQNQGKVAAPVGRAVAGSNDEVDGMMKQEQTTQEQLAFCLSMSPVFVLPMDGYHLYREQLSKMDDPETAFRRRGAPYTFNPIKYANDMEKLRTTGKLSAPGFDHVKKDPDEDTYQVEGRSCVVFNNESNPKHNFTISRPIVIVEGIYCLFAPESEDPAWFRARKQFDLLMYLRVAHIDVATERLTQRHMQAWGIPESEARLRAAGSDRENGLLVIEAAEKLVNAVVLQSEDDSEYVAVTK